MRQLTLFIVILLGSGQSLCSLSIDDVLGAWAVDADGTWNSMKDINPKLWERIAKASPEQLAGAKNKFVTDNKSSTAEITANKLIFKDSIKKDELPYKVVSIKDDTISLDISDQDGQAYPVTLVVRKDGTIMFSQAGMSLIYKRPIAALKQPPKPSP